MRGGHQRNSTNDKEGYPEPKPDAALIMLFSIKKCIDRSKHNLYINFPLQQGSIELKTYLCVYRKH
jgi:hypothetical protein